MPVGGEWPLGPAVGAFALAAAVIAWAGTRLSGYADELADRTGLGEAFVGAVLLGATTSLPGISATVTAAWQGHASLAVSTAVGGIAVQTLFLAIADVSHRRANLEHAAASLPNMLSGLLLIVLLALILLAALGPPLAFAGVHPVTPLLFVGYVYGLRLIRRAHEAPMWYPRRTGATTEDVPDEAAARVSLGRLAGLFAVTGGVVAAAGWVLARAGQAISVHTGLDESVVGALLVATATSLPELVTSLAAVQRGALTLAVGGILGGNAFDTLFAALADLAYRRGSVYHAASGKELMLLCLTILMTAVLTSGLLVRERRGVANIGFESLLLVLFYGLGVILLVSA